MNTYEFEKWRAICVSVGVMGGWLQWVVCLRCCRASVDDVSAWVTWRRARVMWQRCWPGWCASVGKVGGVVTWVAYCSEKRWWCWTKCQDGVLDNIVGGALFLKLIPKTGRKWIPFKARKRIQVSGPIHSKHILFFRVSLGSLNLGSWIY